MNRWQVSILVVILALLATGCGKASQACPADSLTFIDESTEISSIQDESEIFSAPQAMTIGGKQVQVNQVVHGPLCNNALKGTVYVACDIQVQEWEKQPNFLDGCKFEVEPGSVVYVGAHNDAAYYNGCSSCHGGD